MQNGFTDQREKIRSVIVQLCLPHYRVPLYSAISRQLEGSFAVIAGPYSYEGSPKSVDDTPDITRIRVSNYFLMNRFAFQTLPALAFNCPIAVLEFDSRIVSNLWLFLVRRHRKLPVILWGHGLSRRRNSPRWIVHLRRWMAHQADALIFYDERGRQDFLKLGLPEEKLFVANNSIDVERIQSLSLKNRAKRKNILYIGRLIPAKKADLLIEGFARAYNRLPEGTRLVIVGDGPERGRLTSLVQAHEIAELVDLAGEITDDAELAPRFAESAVCVSPGYVGLSAIHSLAFGVPLLVADAEPHSPEIEVFLPGKTGEFFKANDADALADSLVKLLANRQLLADMGKTGWDLVQAKYSVQHMADVFLRAFDYVLRID